MSYVHMPSATEFEGMLGGAGTEQVWIRPVGGGGGNFLGELALVRSFVRWASRHQVYDVLDHLLEPEERVVDGLAVRLARTANQLKALPDDPAEPAAALVVPEHGGAAVRWLVAFDPAPVLASEWGELRLEHGVLTVVPRGGAAIPVTGWQISEGAGELETEGGNRAVTDPELLEMLVDVGRGAQHITVRQVSARSAFTPLLVALNDGLQDVLHQHGDMVISRTAG
jgi:hypothetical protein